MLDGWPCCYACVVGWQSAMPPAVSTGSKCSELGGEMCACAVCWARARGAAVRALASAMGACWCNASDGAVAKPQSESLDGAAAGGLSDRRK